MAQFSSTFDNQEGNIKIPYTGSPGEESTFPVADCNCGDDRSTIVSVSDESSSVSVDVSIKQSGYREQFIPSDDDEGIMGSEGDMFLSVRDDVELLPVRCTVFNEVTIDLSDTSGIKALVDSAEEPVMVKVTNSVPSGAEEMAALMQHFKEGGDMYSNEKKLYLDISGTGVQVVDGKNTEGFYAIAVGDMAAGAFEGSGLSRLVVTGDSGVADGAFKSCDSLKTVEIENSGISIGEGSFEGCTSLYSINLHNASSISELSFSGCVSLEDIFLSDWVSIGQKAFDGCKNLSSVTYFGMDEGESVSQESFGVNGIDIINVAPFYNGDTFGGVPVRLMEVPDPIAKYDPTGHTNEDMAEYPVLTDLTGNGHDITCNNFAWTEESGISTVNHPNALVSDGVDDYGICETPFGEVGTVIIMLDEIKWDALKYLYNAGAGLEVTSNRIFCWKPANEVIASGTTNEEQGGTIKQTPIDGKFIVFTRNPNEITSNFYLFGNSGKGEISIALYSLEIYDRDLTPYQIEAIKKRLMDKYNNPEDTTSDWYGVEWYTNQSPSRVMRIGNMNMHRTLSIQSGMYRCILNDNGEEVYKLDPNDSTKKEDGTPAVLDGTDGQVMVYIPVFYARFESKGYRRRVKLSDHYKPGFIKMGGCYISAYEATVDRTISTLIKLASVVNTTADFRGGNNNAEWDGTYRSLLGMPTTATSLTNFRTYARNRKADNTEWNCMDYHAYKALYWLYVVEYANRNCQLDFNDALTSEGFRQGGLGAGVTNINGTKWNTFNGYYPFIKCGYTNSLGNKTGVVAYTMPDEYDAKTPLTTYVPSYRGVENPFGHIWKCTDGLHIKIQSEEAGGRSILYAADDPASYQDSNYDGYEEISDIARTEGYVKDILFDDGDMLPTVTTGSSSTKDFSDYFYTNVPASGETLRVVLFGGYARNGAASGFAYAYAADAPSYTNAYIGSRLCFIPGTARSAVES